MRRIKGLLFFLLFFPLVFRISLMLLRFVEEIFSSPLCCALTPYALFLFPLGVEGEGLFLSPFLGRIFPEVKKLEILIALLPFLGAFFLFVLNISYVYFYASIRRKERYFLLLGFLYLFYLLSFFYFFFSPYKEHPVSSFTFFYSLILLLLAGILYVGVIFERSFSFSFFLLGASLVGILLWGHLPRNAEEERAYFLAIGYGYGVFSLGVFLYSLYALLRKKIDYKRFFLLLLLLSLYFPWNLAPFLVDKPFPYPFLFLFFIPAIFAFSTPVALFYGGFSVVYFPISSRWHTFLYGSFFLILYWIIGAPFLLRLGEDPERILYHSLALLFLFVVVDPLRLLFLFWMKKRIFLRQEFLTEKFQEVLLANYRKEEMVFFEIALQFLRESIGISWFRVLLSSEYSSFFSSSFCLFQEKRHPIFSEIRFLQRGRKLNFVFSFLSSHIAYLLQNYQAFAFFPFRKLPGGILFGYKEEGKPLFSEEVRFLRSFTTLLEDYIEREVLSGKKKQIASEKKALLEAGKIQKKILPPFYEEDGIGFYYYYRSYLPAGGDYLDFFLPKKRDIFVLLGDVSGHGLGSSYLAAVIRGILRGFLFVEKGELKRAFSLVNRFLLYYYRGGDFLTLFGIEILQRKKELEIRYINAGHPAGILWLKRSKVFLSLPSRNHLLGVMDKEFEEKKLYIHEPIRLFLFSDGAFEIFDEKGEFLGEEGLKRWIGESLFLSPKEQIQFLKKKFHSLDQKEDDISLLILDVSPIE